MREEYVRRARAGGTARAWLWYWRETLSALANFGARRPSAHRIQGDPYVRSFFSDLRIAARALANAPLSTTLSMLTLALGIGAIGAVFSVVNPILLRPLPYPDPGRLVFVSPLDQTGNTSNIGFATFDDLRRDVSSMRASAAMGSWQPTIAGASDAERMAGQRVSWTYFRILGVRPAMGRDFAESEDAPGQRVVVLSNRLWRRHFGGDSSIVGRTIDIEGTAHTVAGVMGPDFENVTSPTSQIWRTLTYAPEQSWACRTCQHLRMIARLPQETSLEAATADVRRAGAALAARFPKEYASGGMELASLKARMTAPYKDALFVLFAAAVPAGRASDRRHGLELVT
jgi:putative ABC transport system permease protein